MSVWKIENTKLYLHISFTLFLMNKKNSSKFFFLLLLKLKVKYAINNKYIGPLKAKDYWCFTKKEKKGDALNFNFAFHQVDGIFLFLLIECMYALLCITINDNKIIYWKALRDFVTTGSLETYLVLLKWFLFWMKKKNLANANKDRTEQIWDSSI